MKNNFIDNLFKENIDFNLNFENLNNKINYNVLIQKGKEIRRKRNKRLVTTFASIVIIIASCLSFLFLNNNNNNGNNLQNDYFEILNSKDFAFYSGAQCPLMPTFETAVLSQDSKVKPLSFYKVQFLEIDELYTAAYIPNNYYNTYYNDYNEYSDMSNYLHSGEFFNFYRSHVYNNEDSEPIIWREYTSKEDIKNKIDEGYTLSMLLRSRDVKVISNETKKRLINTTKRLYMNIPFHVKDNNHISPFNNGYYYDPLNLEGNFLWGIEEEYIENDDVAFKFSTLSKLKSFNRLININNAEAIVFHVYRTYNNEDENQRNKIEYGIFWDKLLESYISYEIVNRYIFMYCDYNEIKNVIYK